MASYLTRFVPQAEEVYPVLEENIIQPPQGMPLPQVTPPVIEQQPQDVTPIPTAITQRPTTPTLPENLDSEEARNQLAQAAEIQGFDRVPGALGDIVRTIAGKKGRNERIQEALRDIQLKGQGYDRDMKRSELERRRSKEDEKTDPNSAYNQNLRKTFQEATNLNIPDTATVESFPLLARFAMDQQSRQQGLEDFAAKEGLKQQNKLDLLKARKRRGRGGSGGSSRGPSGAAQAGVDAIKQAYRARFEQSGVPITEYEPLIESLTGNPKRDKSAVAILKSALPTATSTAGLAERADRDSRKDLQKFEKVYRPLKNLRTSMERLKRLSKGMSDNELRAAMTVGPLSKIADNLGLGNSSVKKIQSFRQRLASATNVELKDRSGAAVTDQELGRLFNEWGVEAFGSPRVFRRALGEKLKDNYNSIQGLRQAYDVPRETSAKKGSNKVVVSNGKETYRINKSDLSAARKDGFKVVK